MTVLLLSGEIKKQSSELGQSEVYRVKFVDYIYFCAFVLKSWC